MFSLDNVQISDMGGLHVSGTGEISRALEMFKHLTGGAYMAAAQLNEAVRDR